MKTRQGNVEMLDLQLSGVRLMSMNTAMSVIEKERLLRLGTVWSVLSLMVSLTVSLSMMLEKMREFEQLMGLIPLFLKRNPVMNLERETRSSSVQRVMKFVNWTLVARRSSVVSRLNETSVLLVLTTKMMLFVMRYVGRPVDLFVSLSLLAESLE